MSTDLIESFICIYALLLVPPVAGAKASPLPQKKLSHREVTCPQSSSKAAEGCRAMISVARSLVPPNPALKIGMRVYSLCEVIYTSDTWEKSVFFIVGKLFIMIFP